jgi:hypothetical protein
MKRPRPGGSETRRSGTEGTSAFLEFHLRAVQGDTAAMDHIVQQMVDCLPQQLRRSFPYAWPDQILTAAHDAILDNTEVTSAYGYGSHIASSPVAVYLDEDSPEGEYEGKTEAWSGQVHFGCSVSGVFISINIANYQLNSQDSQACYFWACDTSAACTQGRTPRSKFPPNGICPAFANIKTLVVWIPPVPLRACYTLTAIPIPSCSP